MGEVCGTDGALSETHEKETGTGMAGGEMGRLPTKQ